MPIIVTPQPLVPFNTFVHVGFLFEFWRQNRNHVGRLSRLECAPLEKPNLPMRKIFKRKMCNPEDEKCIESNGM